MGSHKAEGIATLLSSVTHGGDVEGTDRMFRREKIVQPDLSVEEVPVISGNALRGVLRDVSASLMWEALGRPELPLPVFHVLWSGGQLAKAGSGKVMSSRDLQRLRSMVPHVSLFGGAGGGRIIEGRLMVGKMVPMCAETAHVMPAGAIPDGAALPSYWDYLQIEEYTRRDDSKRGVLDEAIEGRAITATPEPEPAAKPAKGKKGAPEKDDQAVQMRYGFETLAAGTPVHWWFGLRDVTEAEAGLFAAALRAWASYGAAIGGRSAIGHGRIAIDAPGWVEYAPAITTGAGGELAARDELAAHLEAHKREIIETLSLLA